MSIKPTHLLNYGDSSALFLFLSAINTFTDILLISKQSRYPSLFLISAKTSEENNASNKLLLYNWLSIYTQCLQERLFKRSHMTAFPSHLVTRTVSVWLNFTFEDMRTLSNCLRQRRRKFV